jgi:hypothetical protein
MSVIPTDQEVWKACTACGIEKPLVNFHKAGRGLHGRTSKCRKCVSRYNKTTSSARYEQRRVNRLKAYNMTVEQFDEILAAQDGRCGVCGAQEPGGRHGQWNVDHDHRCCPAPAASCGKCVRGILCHLCNRGLGLFRDDVDRLTSAIAYLVERDFREFVTGGR